MAAAIIELYALAYAVRAAAEDEYPFFLVLGCQILPENKKTS